VRVESLGAAVGEAQWNEKGTGRSCAEIGRHPALHLDGTSFQWGKEPAWSLVYLDPKSQG